MGTINEELKKIKELIEKQTVAFATINYDNITPHTVALEINRVEEDKLIITDNHMNKTFCNNFSRHFFSHISILQLHRPFFE